MEIRKQGGKDTRTNRELGEVPRVPGVGRGFLVRVERSSVPPSVVDEGGEEERDKDRSKGARGRCVGRGRECDR